MLSKPLDSHPWVAKPHFVVAVTRPDGTETFMDVDEEPLRLGVPGLVDTAWMWMTSGVPTLPDDVGRVPNAGDGQFPQPGDTRFGLVWFPAESAGKLDLRAAYGDAGTNIDLPSEDPEMHRSDSIDYEVILTGQVDIALEGGEIRTLTPGSCLMMGGSIHAWRNHYPEPCVMAAVVVGANRR